MSSDRLTSQNRFKFSTMPRIKERKKDEAEERLQEAIKHYHESFEPCIRSSAEKFAVAYSTLRGRLKGRQSRVAGHLRMQVLTEYEEGSLIRWCERLDEWGHPARLAMVRSMAEAIVARRVNDRPLGKNWITRFLNRHPQLAVRLSTRLDRQRALASDPVVLKDYFSKVCSLYPLFYTTSTNPGISFRTS